MGFQIHRWYRHNVTRHTNASIQGKSFMKNFARMWCVRACRGMVTADMIMSAYTIWRPAQSQNNEFSVSSKIKTHKLQNVEIVDTVRKKAFTIVFIIVTTPPPTPILTYTVTVY